MLGPPFPKKSWKHATNCFDNDLCCLACASWYSDVNGFQTTTYALPVQKVTDEDNFFTTWTLPWRHAKETQGMIDLVLIYRDLYGVVIPRMSLILIEHIRRSNENVIDVCTYNFSRTYGVCLLYCIPTAPDWRKVGRDERKVDCIYEKFHKHNFSLENFKSEI